MSFKVIELLLEFHYLGTITTMRVDMVLGLSKKVSESRNDMDVTN